MGFPAKAPAPLCGKHRVVSEMVCMYPSWDQKKCKPVNHWTSQYAQRTNVVHKLVHSPTKPVAVKAAALR